MHQRHRQLREFHQIGLATAAAKPKLRKGKQMKRIALVAAAASAAATATAAALWLAVPAGASSAGRDVSGIEHFQLVTTSATTSTQGVIATGVFTAGGVDHQGSKVDTFVFPGGSFKVAHSQGTGTQHLNPATCLVTVRVHGTYTLSGGTGKYAGIRGHGIYHLNILGIAARSGGKCTMHKPPVVWQQIIQAAGPVTR